MDHTARIPKNFWSSESLQPGSKVCMLLLDRCVGGRGGEPICRQLSTVLVWLSELMERELPRKPAAFVLLFLGRNGSLWLWEQCLCILPVAEWEISQVQSLRISSTIGLGRKSYSSLCQVSVSPTWGDGLAFFFLSLHFLFLWIKI